MVTPAFVHNRASLFHSDCVGWLVEQPRCSLHACLTDPPYGLVEYSVEEQAKLRQGRGGVWRIPPSFDGHPRSPLPRFTTLDANDLRKLDEFFTKWALTLLPALVPGAHLLVASNPVVSPTVTAAIVRAGFERRGEVIRLVMTMRGGDRPKNAHVEFGGVSVLPRSMYEPWLLFRRPLEGRVQDNLRKWKTGGLRRISSARPFGDVIKSHPARKNERALAPHPSLKPQAFLRQVVRAMLPLSEGIVLDPFAGSGSTLAAAEAEGYESIGIESDEVYVAMAKTAIPELAKLGSMVDARRTSGPSAPVNAARAPESWQ
jgi:site-specific DNA-methyltransferase (adenine-specific)